MPLTTRTVRLRADRRPPVFIIGGSRTGSEMLKTMLSTSPDLDFADEMFVRSPWWLHKDLKSSIRDHVGDLDREGALDALIDFLYSGKPYGWFWTCPNEQMDRIHLMEQLSGKPLTLQNIFDAIITEHARKNGKNGRGAKFPMHYAYTNKLLEWYPDCRLIHTTRNPKAVYASQSVKYLMPEMSAVSREYLRFKQFVHINIQTAWTARLHRQLRGLENYRLVRYEDVVLDPENSVRQLCDFLKVDYLAGMLSPEQYGSSFSDIGDRKGIDSIALDRWRNTISGFTQELMNGLHFRNLGTLGYSRD